MEEGHTESEDARESHQKSDKDGEEPDREDKAEGEEMESQELDGQKDYYDLLLRTQAEFENYKKRTEKEMCGYRDFANAQLVKDLLMVIDDFQNALSTPAKGADEQFVKGMELIFKNFYGVLEKEGLGEIKPENESFDPWKHEAVEMVPTDAVPEHTIIGVIQPGYIFKDKVIRPAKVRVAVEPKPVAEKAEEEEPEDKET
jgi:molecular chaperone GrpE